MSLRARPTPTKETLVSDTASSTTTSDFAGDDVPETPKPQPPPPSLSQRALSQTLTGTASLAKLLPTGTLLALQLLTPIFTNSGSCDSTTRPMTFILLVLLALSCFLACFTDSFRSSDGQVHYGFVTFKGMWLFDYPTAAGLSSGLPDLRKYRLSFIDVVHAISSVFVLVALALRDKNVVSCFYPMPAHETQEVLDIVPIGIGFLCSLLFVVFPTRRHGIGYPVTSST
ncbi:protein DMP3-like [Camellia sinensis]|uniref:DUF679 domain-containing protein n=1 Tax=Camellia sinensis var. sinensis TaxID=542762 RepID=A0A4S4E3Y5_CAMSN|nr:protein DMP3-like [Camellia sinensis]THG09975.1 hypothetical protein TEA_018694 [Camellia sinensis var. sinensis]